MILKQTQKWLLPSPTEKLVSGASFKDSYGTFLLNLRKAFVFRLLRLSRPDPALESWSDHSPYPLSLRYKSLFNLIECLGSEVKVKLF